MWYRIEEAALRRKREEEDQVLAEKECRKKKKAKLASKATLSFLGGVSEFPGACFIVVKGLSLVLAVLNMNIFPSPVGEVNFCTGLPVCGLS